MFPIAEITDPQYAKIKHHYQQLVGKLMTSISQSTGTHLKLAASDDLFANGMDQQSVYFVVSGSLGVRLGRKHLYFYEPNDLIIPDIGAGSNDGEKINYFCDSAIELKPIELRTFFQEVTQSPAHAKMWTQVLIAHKGLITRALANQLQEETHAKPGFESFAPGEIIMQQGDPADYVYSLFEGEADVLVGSVQVGTVREGEVIGAIAVLTGGVRSATIKAKTRCSVVKVPRDQFASLIRTNPNMIHQLLSDMAKHIVSLNEQVVSLKSGRV